MQTVVSNTSPIIILAKTGNLNLLKNIFDKVLIPQTVYNEVTEKHDNAYLSLKQVDFIEIVAIEKNETLENLYSILDKGEAEAISLAHSLNLFLIIDEKKGRKVAQNFKLNIVGFLGILLINFKKGFISKDKVLETIESANTFGYRLSENLKNEFLKNL